MSDYDRVTTNEEGDFDVVYLNSRRETQVLLVAFVVFLVWSVGVSWLMGYGNQSSENVAVVAGIPRWVFWGVCVPWGAATLFTIWFAQVFMVDDQLAEPSDELPSTTVVEQDA